MKQVIIYTDGACSKNPGPGGYGVVLIYQEHTKEVSGGEGHTTNNRMEITAAIKGLEALKQRCQVIIYSDSKYLVNSMSKGWVARWKRRGWMRNKREPALNTDLWERLLKLCEFHKVNFHWVSSDNEEINRCHHLAQEAIRHAEENEVKGGGS